MVPMQLVDNALERLQLGEGCLALYDVGQQCRMESCASESALVISVAWGRHLDPVS